MGCFDLREIPFREVLVERVRQEKDFICRGNLGGFPFGDVVVEQGRIAVSVEETIYLGNLGGIPITNISVLLSCFLFVFEPHFHLLIQLFICQRLSPALPECNTEWRGVERGDPVGCCHGAMWSVCLVLALQESMRATFTLDSSGLN